MKRLKNGLSMTAILVLVITGITLVLVLCTMALFLRTYGRSLLRNVQTSSRQAVEQVSNTVGNYVADMRDIMELLETTLEDPEVNRGDFFPAFLQIRPDVVAVTTYSADGQLLDCWSLGREPRAEIMENLSYSQALAQSETGTYISQPHVESIFEGYYPWVVTMAAALDDPGEAAWVALDISFSRISTYINNVGMGQHGYCFLMDQDGGIIYHPQQQLIYSSLKQENTELIAGREDGVYVEDNVIYAVRSVAGSGWQVVGVSYAEELINADVTEVSQLLGLAAVVLLLAGLISTYVLSAVLSRPIQGLSAAMRQFEQDAGRFSYVPVGGAREVRELSASFDHMVGQIQRLMDTVRREEINLRKTELKALQAQINPHFLYNTLDSIAWMCEQGRNAEAVQMVNALARLFRISISRGHELIPIRSELQHAESYLQIQKHRYKNQFQYRFDVDARCLDFLCNKITLQPIIENAIYHGINGLVDEGEIVITVRPDGDDVVFTVADNGVGMEPEQIQAVLRKERSDHTGIGVKNVDDRLKIYFGEKYGITIESEPDEGTWVTIRMPQVREEAAYENR